MTCVPNTDVRDQSFSSRIRIKAVRNLNRCYQCAKCASGCPVAFAMDFYPNQLIHMVKLGLKEKIIRCKAIWLCVSCQTCTTRCPNEVDVADLMDALREEVLRERINLEDHAKRILQFHKMFLNELNRGGRINELELLLNYQIKTVNIDAIRRFPEDVKLALKLLSAGKLKLSAPKMNDRKQIKSILRTLT